MPETSENPADDEAMNEAREKWWRDIGFGPDDPRTEKWAPARFAFGEGWRAAMAEVRREREQNLSKRMILPWPVDQSVSETPRSLIVFVETDGVIDTVRLVRE